MSFSSKIAAYREKAETRNTWNAVGNFALMAGTAVLQNTSSIFTQLAVQNQYNEPEDTNTPTYNNSGKNTDISTDNQTPQKTLTDDQKREEINKILSGINIKLENKSKDFQQKVIKKYDAITATSKDADEITRRIRNYVKGLEFREQEDSWAAAALSGNMQSAAKKEMPTTRAAYRDLAAQYIETADTEANAKGEFGTLNLREYENLEKESDNVSILSQEQKDIIQKTFKKLDKNGDNELDQNEFAAHFAIMAVINDKGNNGTFGDITAEEWSTTQQALFDIPLEEMNLSEESITKLEKYLQNNKSGKPTREDLINAGISENDVDKILVYIASEHYNTLSDTYYNMFK